MIKTLKKLFKPKRIIYARKGEVVTCENGHPICNIGRNIFLGDLQQPGDLIHWRQPEPAKGTYPIPRCLKCDAEFYRNDYFVGGISMHFKEGWRSGKDVAG